MFLKYWLSLKESAYLINKNLNLSDENRLTENDIIDLAIDQRIDLAIRVKYVDNKQFQTYSSEFPINSSMAYENGISSDDILEFTIYSADDSVIECIDGKFTAKGIYKILTYESLFLDDTVIFQAIGVINSENSEVINFSNDENPPNAIFFEKKIEILKSSLIIQSRQLTDLISEMIIQNKKAYESIEFQSKHFSSPFEQENIQVKEIEADIPPKTDKDKLAHFIKLIIQKSEFMKDGRVPTYSELHTMLSHKYPHEAIPSKNTLKKYLES